MEAEEIACWDIKLEQDPRKRREEKGERGFASMICKA